MANSSPSPRRVSLASRSAGAQWAILIGLSAALVVGLEALHLPAALLLGPMLAAILLTVAEGGVRAPQSAFVSAQAVVGCMIAGSLPLSIGGEMLRNWPLFLGGVVSVVVAANGLGWLLARWRVLPGAAAIWGSAPGAASAMILMAEAYGADMRLVAFMQYLRVVCVAIVASLVSRLWVAGPLDHHPAIVWFPAVPWTSFAETLAVAALGALAGKRLHIPAGPLLLPLAIGVTLQSGGWMTIFLPPWLLAACYCVVGWSVGLRFTPAIIAYAARALPRVLVSILALIAICGGFAAILATVGGIDPLTAYLATSPGGGDSIAIIAASSKVDVPFVMAMQMARILVVLLFGPAIARFVAKRSGAGAKTS
ncbi:membrane protein AbrB duplication [Methylocella silvestris BL2]|uniref:Membrane protein AbrB duplication n=1 Tax=Methylocella silvestris (strain DSM 15510 / CIP 108128 / LMG 27833 / NCIMB 13906 / BL2) TaxID=395965 RepID=B8ELT3_METSB|nr:AbrB family transcriptional regulator [Methylocella silvestris]ACK50714.1 membrane protein AbrB duplication [Methylocella silvestris BL2]